MRSENEIQTFGVAGTYSRCSQTAHAAWACLVALGTSRLLAFFPEQKKYITAQEKHLKLTFTCRFLQFWHAPLGLPV